jgi:hypothetical protein
MRLDATSVAAVVRTAIVAAAFDGAIGGGQGFSGRGVSNGEGRLVLEDLGGPPLPMAVDVRLEYRRAGFSVVRVLSTRRRARAAQSGALARRRRVEVVGRLGTLRTARNATYPS